MQHFAYRPSWQTAVAMQACFSEVLSCETRQDNYNGPPAWVAAAVLPAALSFANAMRIPYTTGHTVRYEMKNCAATPE